MRWSVVTFKKERHTLLTSDRPIIMTNGIVGKDHHLALPIGPRMLFIAANTIETENMIRTIDPGIMSMGPMAPAGWRQWLRLRHAAQIDLTVTDGKVSGHANVSGTVSLSGNVRVTIGGAYANGQLAAARARAG